MPSERSFHLRSSWPPSKPSSTPGRAQLDLTVKVRDASFPTADEVLARLETPVFRNAAAEIRARCDDLQAAVTAAGSDVDLVCDGRLS